MTIAEPTGGLKTDAERADALGALATQLESKECTMRDRIHAAGWLQSYAFELRNRTIGGDDTAAFKNFHRSLCARFNYPHDEIDWRRDQVSLEEYIANLVATKRDRSAEWDLRYSIDFMIGWLEDAPIEVVNNWKRVQAAAEGKS